jgi:hypothetical protein
MKEIASAHTTGLAMTVFAGLHSAAAGWVSQSDSYARQQRLYHETGARRNGKIELSRADSGRRLHLPLQ